MSFKQLFAEARSRYLKGEQVSIKRICKEKIKERKRSHHEK